MASERNRTLKKETAVSASAIRFRTALEAFRKADREVKFAAATRALKKAGVKTTRATEAARKAS